MSTTKELLMVVVLYCNILVSSFFFRVKLCTVHSGLFIYFFFYKVWSHFCFVYIAVNLFIRINFELSNFVFIVKVVLLLQNYSAVPEPSKKKCDNKLASFSPLCNVCIIVQ